MDFLEPLLLFGNPDPDFNASDARAQDAVMIAGNEAIASGIFGDSHPQQTLEVLADIGVDVDHYIECVVENVEIIIKQGVTVDGAPSRLWLPS